MDIFFVRHAIESSLASGVPENTIVLLLLLPIVATVIAAIRQIVGIRGFGIFLPAALSITFVAIGPILGILLFLAIVAMSTIVRFVTRKLKLKTSIFTKNGTHFMVCVIWGLGDYFYDKYKCFYFSSSYLNFIS